MRFDAKAVRATREDLLLRCLLRATAAMNAEMARRVQAAGFPDMQPSFTSLLAQIDTEGTRVGSLARRMRTSRQAASQLLQAVETRGYVERIADPGDGRAVVARHTEAGRRLLLTAIAAMQAIEGEYEAVLGKKGLADLKRLLKALLAKSDPGGALGAE